MDAAILMRIHAHATPALDAVFAAVTMLGDAKFMAALVGLAAAGLALAGRRRDAILVAATGVLVGLSYSGLKLLFHRARPELWPRIVEAHGFSMPSGHALGVSALYPLFARLAARRWPRARAALVGLAVGLIATIAFSRLYLGVHWPTDVLAGLLIGSGLFVTCGTIFERERS